ncbi:MAG: hypothetical protein IJU23_14895 [Proteobacteria bacterium]|nr:hypothetical protein [Pseudomonadota bacterium]
MKTLRLTTIAMIAILMATAGCDMMTRRSSDRPQNTADEPDVKSPEGFLVDDTGTTRLLPPSEVQQHEGREISTTEKSNMGATSMLPGKNWIYMSKTKGGSFLVAAASHAGTTGGDMIRRIDLGGTIKEFDYDDETKGAQGAYIYVPDEMRNAVPSKLIDADGMYTGVICGFVPGPNKTIIALSGSTEGGVGFVINPYETASAFTPLQAIRMPYAANPCQAVYSEQNKKLYIIDVTRTESQTGQTGIFVADIYNDGKGMVASYYAVDMKTRINSHSIPNFMGIQMYDDYLYLLSGNGRFDSEWDEVVYSVPLNSAGEPIFAEYKYTRMNNPIVRADGCALDSWNIGAISIVEQNGKPIVLVSATDKVLAFEINEDRTLKKIDMNEKKPGTQGIDFIDNGLGGMQFEYSPDGKSLYLLSHCRSNKNKIKITSTSEEFVHNITSFRAADLKQTDPIDIGYREFLTTLKDAAYRPRFTGVMRDFAIGPKHIGVVGGAASNISGLDAGADVAIVDIGKKTNIVFNKPKDMRRAHEEKYGFKLAAGDPAFERQEQNSHAIIWIP